MITKKDVEEVPGLKQLREAIKMWEEKLKTASGRDAFIIKKRLSIYVRINTFLKMLGISLLFQKMLHALRTLFLLMMIFHLMMMDMLFQRVFLYVTRKSALQFYVIIRY